ncbi:hypothetical protein ACFOLJ_23410 [Rugamonas sp. CCM 8940]|uniref:hypothetical protein n=1 Tax=Rugamonas sp. CCM 8940 TaxID=2765359 RepID=UPI0018F640DF|nr:hypothetical protein [Rugamonas sp. CCM 8940]MBJ7313813.1 hypothetical protein [Rugamonas sp. CCM 8940]
MAEASNGSARGAQLEADQKRAGAEDAAAQRWAFEQESKAQNAAPVVVTSPQSENGVSAVDDPNMQTVIVPGKRMSAQEREDYDKYAMRMSMLQTSTASRSNRSSGKAPAASPYPTLSANEVKLMSRMLNGAPGAGGNGSVVSKLSSGLSPSPFGRDPSYGPVDVRGGPESLRSIYTVPQDIPTNLLHPGENIKGNLFCNCSAAMQQA